MMPQRIIGTTIIENDRGIIFSLMEDLRVTGQRHCSG